MNRQQGFTLIELVVVIIILGILAVTAVPKFINLQGDAREAAIKGIGGAINGASSLVHAKALINGSDEAITIEGTSYTPVNGYPAAADICSLANVVDASGNSTGNVTCTVGTTNTDTAYIYDSAGEGTTSLNESLADTDACRVTYKQAPANGAPTITTLTDGCD